VYHFRLRIIQRHNRDLALQVLERTIAEQEIKALSERLINAQEEERRRIARELHDDLSQQIAAISVSLSNIRLRHPGREAEDGEQLEKLRDRMARLANGIRKLSHELHPAILDYGDLATVLRAHCTEFSALGGVSVSFVANGGFKDLPAEVALCLYRVTQEALRNVAKHSGTTRASVQLERSGDEVSLTVSDRGVGFHLDQARASGGLGLVSIKERIRLVNGTFECKSVPNRGTIVKVEVPVVREIDGKQ
jgi:signal transduction histidine kinase